MYLTKVNGTDNFSETSLDYYVHQENKCTH